MFQRYSRQREVVFDVLASTDNHPTADWIYEKAKDVLPDISIATVYRNLRELVKHGKACVVLTGDGKEHFDAKTFEHPHFVCLKCGMVIDVDTCGATDLPKCKHKVERCDVTFFATCEGCLEDNENKN